MKYLALLLLAGCALPAVCPAQTVHEFRDVTSVYLLPMANGLDQYLANRLTSMGVLQVVTDPQKADAVFTDRLGEAFETRMTELFPPPPKKEEEDEDQAKAPKASGAPPATSFARGKGNVFLVSRKTRAVIWSVYSPPRNSSSAEMDRAAEQIVKRLNRDRTGK